MAGFARPCPLRLLRLLVVTTLAPGGYLPPLPLPPTGAARSAGGRPSRIANNGAAPGRAHAVSQRETGKCALRDSFVHVYLSCHFIRGRLLAPSPCLSRSQPVGAYVHAEAAKKKQGQKRSDPCFFRARRHRTSATDGREKRQGKGRGAPPPAFRGEVQRRINFF